MVETHVRDNFIEWLPWKEGKRIGKVSGNPEELQGEYDYLILTEAFEKAGSWFGKEDPYEAILKSCKAHLAPEGHLILAVDNPLGLTFFAGSKDPFTGKYFEGVEGYPNFPGIRGFSQKSLENLVRKAGFLGVRTYYPYPDYHYMTAMYSKEWLPSPGELKGELRNFQEERIQLFQEGKAYDQIIQEGRFPEFSNSYLLDLTEKEQQGEALLYVKYSVERDTKFRIRTEIIKDPQGKLTVRKVPVGEDAKAHVEGLQKIEKALKSRYEEAGIAVNTCHWNDNFAEFEFLSGDSLEQQLDALLAQKKITEWIALVSKYQGCLQQVSQEKPFYVTEDFQKIFGEVVFPRPLMAGEICNIDWIFSNILIKDQQWQIIDYEWTYFFPIPTKYIFWRALGQYLESPQRTVNFGMDFYELFDITKEEKEIFETMEHRLQKYLLGTTKTMNGLWQESGGKVIPLGDLMNKVRESKWKVYYDRGQGFSEQDSKIIDTKADFYGRRRCSLVLPGDVCALRLDPGEEACVVTVNRICGECQGSYEALWKHNGRSWKNQIFYTTADPQIIISELVPGTSEVHIDLTITYPGEENLYGWMEILQKAENYDRISKSKFYGIMKKIKHLFIREKK